MTSAAEDDGIDDPAAEMFEFIEEIRAYGLDRNPNFLVVAQNAPDLYEENATWYRGIIDAIAEEGIWYEGESDVDWDDPTGYNTITNDVNPGWTEEVLKDLKEIVQHMPVFAVEYAQFDLADEVYTKLAPENGFIPYCTRRSLQQLSTTPYPLDYTPQDY